jgi:hypothetical protein
MEKLGSRFSAPSSTYRVAKLPQRQFQVDHHQNDLGVPRTTLTSGAGRTAGWSVSSQSRVARQDKGSGGRSANARVRASIMLGRNGVSVVSSGMLPGFLRQIISASPDHAAACFLLGEAVRSATDSGQTTSWNVAAAHLLDGCLLSSGPRITLSREEDCGRQISQPGSPSFTMVQGFVIKVSAVLPLSGSLQAAVV